MKINRPSCITFARNVNSLVKVWIETLRNPMITDMIMVSEYPNMAWLLTVFVNLKPVKSCFKTRARLINFFISEALNSNMHDYLLTVYDPCACAVAVLSVNFTWTRLSQPHACDVCTTIDDVTAPCKPRYVIVSVIIEFHVLYRVGNILHATLFRYTCLWWVLKGYIREVSKPYDYGYYYVKGLVRGSRNIINCCVDVTSVQLFNRWPNHIQAKHTRLGQPLCACQTWSVNNSSVIWI